MFPSANVDYRSASSLSRRVPRDDPTLSEVDTFPRNPHGDTRNVLLYPAFVTMSRRLEAGYVRPVRELTSSTAERCLVAPAEPAFRAVFEEQIAMGIDPKSKESLFRGLYTDDRRPTLAGSYLLSSGGRGGNNHVRARRRRAGHLGPTRS